MRDTFQKIHDSNAWGGSESVSGPGSSLKATQWVRAGLPALLDRYGVGSLLDIPCGDFHWMCAVMEDQENIRYVGADILPDLVKWNGVRWPKYTFVTLDITESVLPVVDLVLVRDCLVHFSFEDANRALTNVYGSGSRYLLMTHFPVTDDPNRTVYNVDMPTGRWRPVDFTKPPFNLPPPLESINEGNAGHPNKELALWSLR